MAVTWATLMEVLRIIELGELAKEVEEKYVMQGDKRILYSIGKTLLYFEMGVVVKSLIILLYSIYQLLIINFYIVKKKFGRN